MNVNFMPNAPAAPALVAATEELTFVPGSLAERVLWAQNAGFGGVELLATGEPGGVYVPTVDADDRADLRDLLQSTCLVVQAPHQQTWDVSLVSPSSAIRRASLTEIWAVCRFAGMVGGNRRNVSPPLVLVRTGTPPIGVGADRVQAFLLESLAALDRMAGEHGVQIGIATRDVMQSPQDWDILLGGQFSNTGIAFDACHALHSQTPEAVASSLRQIADVLVSVRVGDSKNCKGADNCRTVLANALREMNYQGMVSLAAPELGAGGDGETALCESLQKWGTALHPAENDPRL